MLTKTEAFRPPFSIMLMLGSGGRTIASRQEAFSFRYASWVRHIILLIVKLANRGVRQLSVRGSASLNKELKRPDKSDLLNSWLAVMDLLRTIRPYLKTPALLVESILA